MAEPHGISPAGSERSERAAIRRRWINLGEVLAVIGVLISALALWNSWSERSAGEKERAAEKAEHSHVSRTLLLKASGGGKRLALAPHDGEQAILGQTILFPTALGVGPIEATDARIEADWVKRAVKKADEDGKARKRPGDLRMPVAISTRFASGSETLVDTALYDVGYTQSGGGLLGGTDIALKGLSLVQRTNSATAQRRLDALWATRTSGK